MNILIVGNPGPEHVGAFMLKAAKSLGWTASLADVGMAAAPRSLAERLRYRISGRRPAHLARFSKSVVELARRERPHVLLATGCVPLLSHDLLAIRKFGVRTANFTTDDPWNPAHRAGWFLASLPAYDLILSPRRATFADFLSIGVERVEYLPFAYDPEMHHRVKPTAESTRRFASQAMFYGGADRDRAHVFRGFVGSGINLALYGSYWQRYPEFAPYYRGMLEPKDVASAVASTQVTICFGRRANRDSHAMRSYEAPAMGACMVAEDTADHRAIFGGDGAVEYFQDAALLPRIVHNLLSDGQRIAAMRSRVLDRVVQGHNTYADRLKQLAELFK